MKFSRADADVYAPDGSEPEQALARTTHLCVGAHPDDVEIMAFSGIAQCHGRADLAFTSVVATDGAGSPRTGPYAGHTDEQMRSVRRAEQRAAAQIGRYGLQIQLSHPSGAFKAPGDPAVASDLDLIFGSCTPRVVYLHNPADKHDTHVGVLLRCLEALRRLPPGRRPGQVLGCEVWRGLDWLDDASKVALDCGSRQKLAVELLKVFDSQVAGGKRYDKGAVGRRAANATFHASHATDRMSAVNWAVDLTGLLDAEGGGVERLILGRIDELRRDVGERIRRLSS